MSNDFFQISDLLRIRMLFNIQNNSLEVKFLEQETSFCIYMTKCFSVKFIHQIVKGDAYVSSETPLGDNSVRVQSPKRVFLIYLTTLLYLCTLTLNN